MAGRSCIEAKGLTGFKEGATLGAMAIKQDARDGLMTVQEAASLVGVTPAAVYDRIKTERLKSQRSYGVIVVPRADVEAWRSERKTQALRVLES